MSESASPAIVRRSPIAACVFCLVLLPLWPWFVAGYVIWIGRSLPRRRSAVSFTAQGPLAARWLQDRLGVRRDEPARRLLLALPDPSPLAVWLVFGPILLAHRLSGYVPTSFRYPFEGEITLWNQGGARQTFYDAVVERYLPEVAQLVILGAGFDTRALRLPAETPIRAYEIDTPGTMAAKRAALAKAGIATRGVALVDADFEHDPWLDRLVTAGFDTTRPTLFLWEGVTLYLDRAAVEETLRAIASVAPGSVVAFDYFTTDVLESSALMMRAIRASVRAGGEPLRFGVESAPPSRERAAELLRSCGLTLIEGRTLGSETGTQRAWGGFAVAAVGSRQSAVGSGLVSALRS